MADGTVEDYTWPPPGHTRRRWLEQLLEDGKNRTLRIAVVGDSQEAPEGGYGSLYADFLGLAFHQLYGNTPGTKLAISDSTTYFCGHQSCIGHADGAASIDSDIIPTGMAPILLPDEGGAGLVNICNTKNDEGQITESVQGVNLFDPTGGARLELFCGTLSGGSEVKIQYCPKATAATGFFETVVSEYTTTATSWTPSGGLDDDPDTFKRHISGVLAYVPATPYPQVKIRAPGNGEGNNQKVLYLGSRWLSEADKSGAVIDYWSAGGYQCTDHMTAHPDMGGWFDVAAYDLCIIRLGANDAYYQTPAQWKTNMPTLIDELRRVNTDMGIIIMPDVWNNQAPVIPNLTEFPTVAKELCETYDRSVMCNLYRAMHEIGLNPTDYDTYLADGVHYVGTAITSAIAQQTVKLVAGMPVVSRRKFNTPP